ncbi:hypothetical protein M9458_021173, partial [Cirrhinus mrigala]
SVSKADPYDLFDNPLEQSPELALLDTAIVPYKTRLFANIGSQQQASNEPGPRPALTPLTCFPLRLSLPPWLFWPQRR